MKTCRNLSLPMATLLVAAIGLSGCEDKGNFENTPPTGLGIYKERCYVWRESMVLLVGSAGDVEEDPLSFRWEASGGTFSPASGEGRTVYWKAPDELGVYTIRMYVTDSFAEVSLLDSITVCNEFPSIISSSTTIRDKGFYILLNLDPIEIPAGITLTLNAGVVVVVDAPGGGFDVRGRLVASGTSVDHVRFIPNECMYHGGEWMGITFSNYATGQLINADVVGGGDGVMAKRFASVTIDSCLIIYNDLTGVSVIDTAAVTIRNSTVWDNGAGIFVKNASLNISYSSIRFSDADNFQIRMEQSNYPVNIEQCTIANAYVNGLLVLDRARPEIHHCAIYSNGDPPFGGYAILLGAYLCTDSLNAQENFWGLGNVTATAIKRVIYDREDNPDVDLAYVDFSPWLTSPPVTPEATARTEAADRTAGAVAKPPERAALGMHHHTRSKRISWGR